jgi:hypothetical protein
MKMARCAILSISRDLVVAFVHGKYLSQALI